MQQDQRFSLTFFNKPELFYMFGFEFHRIKAALQRPAAKIVDLEQIGCGTKL